MRLHMVCGGYVTRGPFATPTIRIRLTPTGDYPPSLRSPWYAADAENPFLLRDLLMLNNPSINYRLRLAPRIDPDQKKVNRPSENMSVILVYRLEANGYGKTDIRIAAGRSPTAAMPDLGIDWDNVFPLAEETA